MKRSCTVAVFSIIIIALVAMALGAWFATQQLHAVTASPAAWAAYPKIYWYITAAKCFFTVLVSYALSYLLCAKISQNKVSSLWIALTYLPLLGVFFQIPLRYVFAGIVGLQCLGLLAVWRQADYINFSRRYVIDTAALVILLLLHLFITTQFSPLHYKKALFTSLSEEIPIEAPLYKGYSLAKQFVFSNFDYSEWAAVMNSPITLASPLSQFVTLIFDLPSMDPIAFHIIVDAINFLLIVGGGFGCYLFLRYAAKLSPIFAWLGGALMTFSVAPYLWIMINADGTIFLPSYALLPYCLLFLSVACEKENYALAAWAGVAMAAPFFIMTPHPEGVIYTALCTGLYGLGLLFSSPFATARKRFLICTMAFSTFALLSAYVVVPMFIDQWGGNMYTFAHTSDIEANHALNPEYLHLMKLFIPASLLLLWLRRDTYPAYLPSLFFCLSFNLLLFASTYIGFIHMIVNTLHIGIHLWVPWRMSLFAILSLFLICMMCLDGLTRVLLHVLQLACRQIPARHLQGLKTIGYILFVAKDQQNEKI